MPKESLLVIDMTQTDLKDKNPSDVKRKLATQEQLINRFRKENLPVVYTVGGHLHLAMPEIPSQIYPQKSEAVVSKWRNDAFEGTKLRELLDTGILHIVGCNTDYCVQSTVEGALQLGYEIVIYKNAVLSYKSSTISQLKQFIAWSRDPNIKLKNWK